MGELKALVLGDGLLGKELIRALKCDFVSRKQTGFDINDIETSIPEGYNVIINCIANTDTYSNDKDKHWDVNFRFVSDLIDYCNNKNLKLVHISTDYIYAGSISNASENDVPVHCNNWYGYTKLLADGLVQLKSTNYLLIRCTHKPNPFPYDKAWINQAGNFDYVDQIANLLSNAITYEFKGVYNLGTELKTMHELAKWTNLDVKPAFAPAHIPNDTSMNVEKFNTAIRNKDGLKYTYEIPFFSIAIPTYGYGGKGTEFLEHSFEILKKQTFKNYEIIISDHSIDNTIKDVCIKWLEHLDITYIRNEHGRGIISPNINNAMKYCTGKWIKVLFQDDFLYDENSLQIQYDILEANPKIKWLMTTFYHSNDGVTFYRLYHPVWNDMIWTGNNTMGCPSGMTIKNEDLIYFDEGLNWLMDVDYYKKMFDKHGKPTIISDITAVNRTWGDRLTDTIGQDLKDKEFKILTERYGTK